jgi:hypothetical protein
MSELLLDQFEQIVHVQQVAHLLARAAISHVCERSPEVVGEQPVAEHALVGLAHLPRAGDNAAAEDRG